MPPLELIEALPPPLAVPDAPDDKLGLLGGTGRREEETHHQEDRDGG